MALQAMKPTGGLGSSKALQVAQGAAQGGWLGAGLALAASNNPNLAVFRRMAGDNKNPDTPVDPQGLGSEFAPTDDFGLGVDSSMPGAPQPQQNTAMARRFSLMGGSKY